MVKVRFRKDKSGHIYNPSTYDYNKMVEMGEDLVRVNPERKKLETIKGLFGNNKRKGLFR